MSRRLALVLSVVTGALALSFEVLWYRAYALALMARPQAFGVVLGGYLGGLALGAWLVWRWCASGATPASAWRALPWTLLTAGTAGVLLIPGFAWFVTVSRHWELTVLWLAMAAAPFGAVLPLLSHASVRSGPGVGWGMASLYTANIAGSAAGTVVTGFVLMDRWGLATLSTALGLAEVGLGGVVFIMTIRHGRQARMGLMLVAVLAAVILGGHTPLHTRVMERLFFRLEYSPAHTFRELVENRSGVIGVTADGAVFGSGVYDGVYNVRLARAGENFIHRAYAASAFHPHPRHVLMIGLSSGSWASVIANDPAVETLTIVELNPGYLQLLPAHPPSDGLLRDRKVRIDIDDGRHWLQRHPEARFDLIVANTTYHWRANSSSLLSVEFMQLVRRHLREGGVLFYNATSEPRAERTGASVFPYAWGLYNMVAVSDQPLALDRVRFDELIGRSQVYGVPVFDPTNPDDERQRRVVVDDVLRALEPRDRMLARTAGAAMITDDNMGTEWRLAARYLPPWTLTPTAPGR